MVLRPPKRLIWTSIKPIFKDLIQELAVRAGNWLNPNPDLLDFKQKVLKKIRYEALEMT